MLGFGRDRDQIQRETGRHQGLVHGVALLPFVAGRHELGTAFHFVPAVGDIRRDLMQTCGARSCAESREQFNDDEVMNACANRASEWLECKRPSGPFRVSLPIRDQSSSQEFAARAPSAAS